MKRKVVTYTVVETVKGDSKVLECLAKVGKVGLIFTGTVMVAGFIGGVIQGLQEVKLEKEKEEFEADLDRVYKDVMNQPGSKVIERDEDGNIVE